MVYNGSKYMCVSVTQLKGFCGQVWEVKQNQEHRLKCYHRKSKPDSRSPSPQEGKQNIISKARQ